MADWTEVRLTDFGFKWGPMEVVRAASMPQGRGAVLTIRTDLGAEIEVWVSEKGQRILVVEKAGRVNRRVQTARPKSSEEFVDE